MHLIVGLGNPGARYARNRHNIGFMLVEYLADGASFRDKFSARVARVTLAGEPVTLLMPQTFMNRSGESVQAAARFYGVEPAKVLVVHDELDVPFGRLKLKRGGGVAGHNGLRSIVQHLDTPDFSRLRLGIGRPEVGTVHDWVLGDFSTGADVASVLQDAARAVERVLVEGFSAAMNHVNARKPTPKAPFEAPDEP
ncbi:MAG: aminoacyl-tRNA hydrolase [Sandaracinaceae bacterium]